MPSHAPPRPRNRPLLSIVRNNLLGLIALAFVVAPSSFALAASSDTEAKTTRICVTKGSMLRYVASPGVCRAGEKSFFVSRRGVQGLRGVRGEIGPKGAAGAAGPTGPAGVAGAGGAPGPQGVPGVGATVNYAEYYAPANNSVFVNGGENLQFPEDGPNQGTISRADVTTFTLGAIGTYRVAFSAWTDQNAQVELTLDNVAVPYAAFGSWGWGTLAGETFITTSVANASLAVRNSGGGFMLYPFNNQVAAHLTIQQLS